LKWGLDVVDVVGQKITTYGYLGVPVRCGVV